MGEDRESTENRSWFPDRGEDRELQPTIERLRPRLNNTETGRWEWRPDTASVRVDKRMEDLLGYRPDESPEATERFVSHVHPNDREKVELEGENSSRDEYYETEFRVPRGEQTERWIRVCAAAIDGEDGAPKRLVGLAAETTKQKERERELAWFRTFVEHAPDGLTHIRPDGTMTYVSGSKRILGRSREEMIGEPLERYVHPEDTQKALDFFEEVRAGGDPAPFEGRIAHADGSWMWVETTAISLDDSTHIEGFLTITRSIDERKRYERRIEEQRDNLEILNEVVRHDIRNDLVVVDGNAELLEDHVDSTGRKRLDTIRETTSNAVDLTERARELSEAMLHTDDDLEKTPLSPVLTAQIDDVRTVYPEAEITIGDSVPDATVVADELLDAVFRNLLKNAIQHNEGPNPTVSIAVDRADGGIEIRIADNGPGISDPMKATMFDKSEQGVESSGSGIGLFIVKSLVERYGGDVWVEDNAPEGTVFVVRLATLESGTIG